jgi:hypothetical protein
MHRRKHKPYVFIALGIIAAVAFMTWQDMQRIADRNIARLKLAQYVRATENPQDIPANRLPLYVEAGAVSDAGFRPALAPQTVAQREINLLVKIDHVPAVMAGAGEQMRQLVTDWKSKNNILNELVLDWQTDTPDIEKMPAFATMLSESMQNTYWISMMVQRRWFEDHPATLLDMARRTRRVAAYIFDMREAVREGETLADTVAALNKLNVPFLLIADKLPPRDALSEMSGENDFFGGFILHERLPAK